MNILPKKKWHVRTKENIARVRKDEAQAAEEAREVDRRALLAEQEARTSLLRARARQKLGHEEKEEVKALEEPKEEEEDALIGPSLSDIVPGQDGGVISASGHVNFFQDLEEGQNSAKGNEEHEEEKKKEQEEYEKKVGYLQYLGQDTEELTGDQVWWKKLPSNRKDIVTEEKGLSSVGFKQKDFLDPLKDLRRHLGCDGVQLTLKKFEKKIERTEQKALGIEQSRDRRRDTSKKKKRRRDSSSDDSDHKSRSKKRRRDSSVEDNRRSKKKRRRRSRSSSKSRKSRKQKKDKHRKKSRRKSSTSSSESDSDAGDKVQKRANLDKLRQERLARERAEKERTRKLLYGEEKIKEEEKQAEKEKPPEKVQKYNSQFNPDIAKQNKLDANTKYWLQ